MADSKLSKFDIIILGGGPAGLMAAYMAGRRGKTVLIIDKAKRLGGKIHISGGGKCNFTNVDCAAANFYCSNPHFVKSSLARFTPWDFVGMLGDHNIEFEEREHGRMFCLHSAGEIVNMFEKLCCDSGVQFQLNSEVKDVGKTESGFKVSTTNGNFTAEKLVVALGGFAWPQCGASRDGYNIAEQFGMKLIPIRSGLVPLVYGKEDVKYLSELTGNSCVATVSCDGKSFTEEVLFTHWSLSGPAILQISCVYSPGKAISINWLPQTDARQLFLDARANNGSWTARKILQPYLSQKFVRIWQKRYISMDAVANWTIPQIEAAADSLNNWQFIPNGDDGFRKAEVTIGGVDTDELSSKTMEAKKVPGLYFIGEVVNVAGQLGGYNLQWAWSSGHACGESL